MSYDRRYSADVRSILVEDRSNPEMCDAAGWPNKELYFVHLCNPFGMAWRHNSSWERSARDDAQKLADRINDHISRHPDWTPDEPGSLPHWTQDLPAYGSRCYENNQHYICVDERIRDCAADGESCGPNHESWIGDLPELIY